MPKFVTKTIEAVVGRKHYAQLVILPDNTNMVNLVLENIVGVWDEYEDSLEEKYHSAFRGLNAIMTLDANLESLPKEKFRDITPSRETVPEYEFKFKDLRAYGIKIPNGKLIIFGGYKNAQTGDITRFRSLKRQYLESL